MASVAFDPFPYVGRESRRRSPANLLPTRSLRILFAAGAALLFALAICEGALRGLEAYYARPLAAMFTSEQALVPGTTVGDRTVNTLGYLDDEFMSTAAPGKVRIAVLGGRAVLAGDAATGMKAQLEDILPDVQVDLFGLPEGNPTEYAVRLRRDVLRYRPDFVLVCLTPADDVAAAVEAPQPADVRIFQLTQRMTATASGTADPIAAAKQLTETVDYETYVRRRVATVAVCNTAGDSRVERRWRTARAGLEQTVACCREQSIGLAVVLVPSEFQVSSQLAEALRRRTGVEPAKFDVDLPQRRWSALAEHLQVPTLDLLPTFRSVETVLYHPSSPDWNEQGRRLAATTTAKWLQPRLGGALAAKSN